MRRGSIISCVVGSLLTFSAAGDVQPPNMQLMSVMWGCMIDKIIALDDNVSDARTIATAAVQGCSSFTTNFSNELVKTNVAMGFDQVNASVLADSADRMARVVLELRKRKRAK